MTWTKVSDHACSDQRFCSVSRDARLLHLEALTWTMAGDATGVIRRFSLRRITDAEDPEALVEELVEAGLWAEFEDGWKLVYLLDDQPKPDEIERQKAFNKTKQERHRKHIRGDHSMCSHPVSDPVSNPVTNGVTNPVSNHTPSRPDPSRPVVPTAQNGKDGVGQRAIEPNLLELAARAAAARAAGEAFEPMTEAELHGAARSNGNGHRDDVEASTVVAGGGHA